MGTADLTCRRQEHRRRAPECHFFGLVEEASKIARPTKARKGRASRASKASRLSTQSNMTIESNMASFVEHEDVPTPEQDDTMLTTATIKPKGTRSKKRPSTKKPAPKRARAGTRSKKNEHGDGAGELSVNVEESAHQDKDKDMASEPLSEPEVEKNMGRQPSRRATKRSTAPAHDIDDSIAQSGAKRSTRTKVGKKAIRLSEDQSQLQTELEAESSTAPIQTKPTSKRGKKRTSDGTERLESSVVFLEEKPIPLPQAPAKRGRPIRKASAPVPDVDVNMSEVDEPGSKQPPKSKANSKAKRGRKATTTEMAEVAPKSKAVPDAIAETEPAREEPHPALEPESEYEPQSRVISKSGHEKEALPEEKNVNGQARRSISLSPKPKTSKGLKSKQNQTRAKDIPQPPPSPSKSPQSSDAENKPPSSRPSQQKVQLSTFRHDEDIVPRSPLTTKTPTAKTPSNRRNIIAGGLVSTEPWSAVDLETALLPSPPSSGRVDDDNKENLHVEDVLRRLTSPEKQMTVEEWIMHNARLAEERLRNGCERMIGKFESEGMKALRAVQGIEC